MVFNLNESCNTCNLIIPTLIYKKHQVCFLKQYKGFLKQFGKKLFWEYRLTPDLHKQNIDISDHLSFEEISSGFLIYSKKNRYMYILLLYFIGRIPRNANWFYLLFKKVNSPTLESQTILYKVDNFIQNYITIIFLKLVNLDNN